MMKRSGSQTSLTDHCERGARPGSAAASMRRHSGGSAPPPPSLAPCRPTKVAKTPVCKAKQCAQTADAPADSCAGKIPPVSTLASTAAVTLLLHHMARAPDTHKHASGVRNPLDNLPATVLAATTALALVLPQHAAESLQADVNVAKLFEDELALESSLHVTSFTAHYCEALYSKAAPEPGTNSDTPFASSRTAAHMHAVAHSMSGSVRNADSDPDSVPPLKRGRSAQGMALAACLATPPEPAKTLQRARVVTQTQCERLGECESNFCMSEEFEEAMQRARRWLNMSRRLRLRQARGVVRAAQDRMVATADF